ILTVVDQFTRERGSLPESIIVDNGSEFSGRALEAWAMSNEVGLCFIRPGRFSSLDDARQQLAKFRQHYNHQRPHSALADRTPAAFAALHRPEQKFSTLMGRALQSLLIESLECAKPSSIQEKR